MNCQQYQDLTAVEKIVFLGRLVIAAQQSHLIFDEANALIEKAEIMGIYKTADVNLEHNEF